MMLRALAFLAVLAALTAAAVWFAEHPGDVTIRATIPWAEWPEFALTTSVGVLLVAVAGVAVAAALVHRFWRWLRGGPRRFAEGRAARRREHGYQALTKGLVAIAAGDAKAARRFAKHAGRLLDNPLNLLVLAQAARLNADETSARRHFSAMIEHRETEFLGLRGLIAQATQAGDWDAALGYARRAHALSPESAWASEALFDLEARAGDWRGAQRTLEAAGRKRLGAAEASRRRAVVLAARARVARGEGRDEQALALAREAHKLAPELVEATALAAELLTASGKTRAARKLIEKGWARAPHPELVRAYAALAPDEAAIQRLKRFERLRELQPDHPESRIALAEAALAAELWGVARGHLEAAAGDRPSQRVFRLLATIEEHGGGDAEAIRRWLQRAADAPPDAAWRCEKCGAAATEWSARCAACGAFDGLAWRAPPAPAVVVDAAMAQE